jgi:hypothetical protein
MNLFEWLWWGKDAVSDIQADTAATRLSVNQLFRKIDNVKVALNWLRSSTRQPTRSRPTCRP